MDFSGFREKMFDVGEKLCCCSVTAAGLATQAKNSTAIPPPSRVCVYKKPHTHRSRLSVLLRFLQCDLTSGLIVILLLGASLDV